METLKKIWHFVSSILFYSIIAVAGVVLILFLAYFVDQKIGASKGEKRQPLFGAYIIVSESMVPTINVYDAVVTMRVKQDKISIDDIITFLSKEIETAGTPITHRVIGTVPMGDGSVKYRTKGDNNNTPDFALIAPEEIIGKVLFTLPMIGYIQVFMTKPIGWLLVIVIPCLFIIGGDVLKLIKSAKKDNDNTQDNDNGQSINNSSNQADNSEKPLEDTLILDLNQIENNTSNE